LIKQLLLHYFGGEAVKIEWNKKYTTIAIYSFLVIVASIIFYSVVQNFRGFSDYTSKVLTLLTPFIYGFVIAYILNPILRIFDGKILPCITKGQMKPKHRRALSVLLTYVVAALLLMVFFSFVIPEIISSLTGIVTKFPEYVNSAEQWISNMLDTIESWGIDDAQKMMQTLLLSFDEWLEKGYQIIKDSLPKILNITKQFADGIMNIILGLIISVYLLMSKERFFAQLKKALYALLPAKAVERSIYIAHKSHITFSGISVIVGVTNVIPYFGPFIGAIPGALIILLTDPVKTIWFLIFILALQQFDGNILGPKILGETTGISAFWVIFAIVVFSGLLGVLGMFIGVPLFAVIYTLVREFIDARLEKKGLTINTAEYASEKHKIEF